MKENKFEQQNDPTEQFLKELHNLTPQNIAQLDTIKVWVFKSTKNQEEKYFFIKNDLFESNFREKIRSKLQFGGKYEFVEEIDTGEKLKYQENGKLTSDSWKKKFEKRKMLDSAYTGRFQG